MTDFILDSAGDAAERAILSAPLIQMSDRDSLLLIEALTNPPEPNAALRAAAKSYKASRLSRERHR